MSPKTADYIPSGGGVIAMLLGCTLMTLLWRTLLQREALKVFRENMDLFSDNCLQSRHTLFLISYSKYRFTSLKQKCWRLFLPHYIYNGNIFPSLNPAKNFQFISRWTESTKSSAVGPYHRAVINTKMKLRARCCGNFEFIIFLWEF